MIKNEPADFIKLCFSKGLESKLQVKEFHTNLLKRFPEGQLVSEDVLASEIDCYMTAIANYHLKLAGLIWFDGELPLDPDEKTEYTLLRVPDEREINRRLEKMARRYYGWTCAELARVSSNMKGETHGNA